MSDVWNNKRKTYRIFYSIGDAKYKLQYIYASSTDELAKNVADIFRSKITRKINIKNIEENLAMIITDDEAKTVSGRGSDIFNHIKFLMEFEKLK